MLTFSYPWFFWVLPVAWVVWRIVPAKRPRATALRVPFGKRLERVISGGSENPGRRAGRLLIPTLVWTFVVIALARPQWVEPPLEKTVPTRDLLLLVDLSSSMDQQDFKNAAGKTISRLEAVKEIVGDFLAHREGDRVGLVVFGDAPFVQAPFSTDLTLSRRLLEETAVGMAGTRTALGDAIGLGINLFNESAVPAKTIIALTDGNDTKSQVPPVDAARIAHDRGIRIHTVAIGDPKTVGEDKLDRVTLDQVGKQTGGKSYFAANREELAGIYAELDRIEARKINTVSRRPRRDIYYFPLGVALLIAVGSKISLRSGAIKPLEGIPSIRVDPVTGELRVVS